MVILHHNDNDGRCAAFIVYMGAKATPTEVEFYEMDYGRGVPFHLIKKNEVVYIVDFSIEVSEMEELLKITKNVVWIDHHISAIEKYNGYNKEIRGIRGIREVGKAGCELTWEWFFKGEVALPLAFELIAKNDVYRFKDDKDKERVMQFKAGLSMEEGMENIKGSIGKWYRLFDTNNVIKLLEKGKELLEYRRKMHEQLCTECGFVGELSGCRVFAVNKPFMSSDDFVGVDVKEYDMLVSFYWDGEKWKYGLREGNGTVDCSKIADGFMYNGRTGGGHKGAAGFISERMEIKRMESKKMF